MKKNYFYKITASFFLIFAMLFVSCTGLSESINLENTNIEEMATISVSIAEADSEARLVKPIPKLSEISDLELKGARNSGTQETLGTWSNYSELSIASITIPSGSWEFEFTCKKGSETFRGTTSALITIGNTTKLSFSLSHVASSSSATTGSAEGVIQLPQDVTVQTAILDIKDSSNSVVYSLCKNASEIQNHSFTFNKSALAPGTYLFEILLCKIATTEDEYNSFVQSINTMNGEQINAWRNSHILESFNVRFVVEAGLSTDLSQNFSYLAAPETSMGFKSTRALTDSDGKGYFEFVVKWPTQITYTENGSSHTEYVQAIEISREGGSGLTYNVGYFNNYSVAHPSTVVMCDRYELTQGQSYTYTLRYNWKWLPDTEFQVTLTATADGFGRPTIVCPNTSFNGTTMTCTNLNESDLNLNNCTTQAERNRISDIRISLNYYDESNPNDWGGAARIYSGFSYRYNSPANLWTPERSGVTRKLYEASVVITCGNLTRTFKIPDDQLQSWAAGKVANPIQFATSGN